MNTTASARDVNSIRGFNRFYSAKIGLLDEGHLESPFTLTQARVLYELANSPSPTAGRICATLALDAGYLSRILRDFSRRKLVTRRRAVTDSRRVELSLTATGRKAFAELDRRAHRSIARMLVGLRSSDRQRLLVSMNEVRHALAPPTRSAPRAVDVALRDIRPGDIGWAIRRHGEIYAQEFGWNTEFEGLVATLFGELTQRGFREGERMWIAELHGEPVGCVFIVRNGEDAGAAQLRCLLVDPKARGLGIGHRLVEACIEFARAAGYRKMVLWTNDVLSAARRIYQAHGFELEKESRHHSFGKELVGQTWSRAL